MAFYIYFISVFIFFSSLFACRLDDDDIKSRNLRRLVHHVACEVVVIAPTYSPVQNKGSGVIPSDCAKEWQNVFLQTYAVTLPSPSNNKFYAFLWMNIKCVYSQAIYIRRYASVITFCDVNKLWIYYID